MKHIYKSWHCTMLLVMGAVAFLLAVAESDSLKAFVASKIVAMLLCTVVYRLGKKWAREGKIREITDIND